MKRPDDDWATCRAMLFRERDPTLKVQSAQANEQIPENSFFRSEGQFIRTVSRGNAGVLLTDEDTGKTNFLPSALVPGIVGSLLRLDKSCGLKERGARSELCLGRSVYVAVSAKACRSGRLPQEYAETACAAA